MSRTRQSDKVTPGPNLGEVVTIPSTVLAKASKNPRVSGFGV